MTANGAIRFVRQDRPNFVRLKSRRTHTWLRTSITSSRISARGGSIIGLPAETAKWTRLHRQAPQKNLQQGEKFPASLRPGSSAWVHASSISAQRIAVIKAGRTP